MSDTVGFEPVDPAEAHGRSTCSGAKEMTHGS
jgi:hypothetical protein